MDGRLFEYVIVLRATHAQPRTHSLCDISEVSTASNLDYLLHADCCLLSTVCSMLYAVST
jgi:hypothetical protein